MNIALALLMAAMQLLNVVKANPNLPQSYKDNAYAVANQAIVLAQGTLQSQADVVVQPEPVQVVTPTPVVVPQTLSTSTEAPVPTAPAPEVVAPDCTLVAAPYEYYNRTYAPYDFQSSSHFGSTYPKFTWSFTEGAVATINVPLKTETGQTPTSLRNNSNIQNNDVYGPKMTRGNTYDYTMTVTKDGASGNCSATINF